MNTEAHAENFELLVAPPSTWALRAWLVLKLANCPFTTNAISHDTLMDKAAMSTYSDTGLVPVLKRGNLIIHDSLAIAEFVNELFPQQKLYPADQAQRAQARSLVAELHSGFSAIRTQMPFFIGEPKTASIDGSAQHQLERLQQCWTQAQAPFYFVEAGIVDAFYAVMAARLFRYQIHFKGCAGDYQRRLLDWPLLQEGLQSQTQW